MTAGQRARRTHAPKQNHPRRNKSEAGTGATLRSRPAGELDHAVRVVHGVCCLAGSASLIDDLRAGCGPKVFPPPSDSTTPPRCTIFCTAPGSWPASAPTISMALPATGQVAAPTLLLWWPSRLTPGRSIRRSPGLFPAVRAARYLAVLRPAWPRRLQRQPDR